MYVYIDFHFLWNIWVYMLYVFIWIMAYIFKFFPIRTQASCVIRQRKIFFKSSLLWGLWALLHNLQAVIWIHAIVTKRTGGNMSSKFKVFLHLYCLSSPNNSNFWWSHWWDRIARPFLGLPGLPTRTLLTPSLASRKYFLLSLEYLTILINFFFNQISPSFLPQKCELKL